jgi:hypothetical protein
MNVMDRRAPIRNRYEFDPNARCSIDGVRVLSLSRLVAAPS